jgi:hypothetical protein
VSAIVVRRIASLAAVAVLSVSIALYVAHRGGHGTTLPAPAGPWTTALTGAYAAPARTACGVRVGPRTIGVAHPVLPCGVELYIRFGKRTVLTQVIDRSHTASGRAFDLTGALATLLGVQGTQPIQWRFARQEPATPA